MAELNTLKENELFQKASEQLDKVTEQLDSLTGDVKENAEKAVSAVRGVIARLENSGNDLLNDLVKAGEQIEKEREKERKKAAKASQKSPVENLLERIYESLGLSTQEEVAALNKKLNSLTRKIRKLEKEIAA